MELPVLQASRARANQGFVPFLSGKVSQLERKCCCKRMYTLSGYFAILSVSGFVSHPLESKQGLPAYFASPRNLMSSSAARPEGKSSCLVLVMHEVDERPRAGVRTLWGR
jgi:hypothetical protein